MRIKAAIFDLDGTLIDSMGVWDKIGRDFLTSRGISYSGDISGEVKNMSFMESARYYIDKFSLEDTCDRLISIWNDMAYREYAENIEMKEGARRFLLELSGAGTKLGVATATDRELVEAVLDRHGVLRLFETIVTVREAGRGKEDPHIFLLAAERLKVSPEECTVFEDCLHAVKGAKRAGMQVWAVHDSFSDHERRAIEDIADKYWTGYEEMLAYYNSPGGGAPVADLRLMKKWLAIPKASRDKLLNNCFCRSCRRVVSITDYIFSDDRAGLIIAGKCSQCGFEVVRRLEG